MDTNTVNGQEVTAVEQETEVKQEQQTAASQEPEKTFTQKEINTAHYVGKSEAERDLLSLLGVKSKDDLTKVRDAYHNTLSAEEKLNNDLQQWQTTANTYKSQAEESAYTLAAMEAITGKPRAEVETIVKMAKGLTSEETPFDTAMQTVMGMMAQQQPAQHKPSGFNLLQPDQPSNPKKTGFETRLAAAKTLQEKIMIKQEAYKEGIVLP